MTRPSLAVAWAQQFARAAAEHDQAAGGIEARRAGLAALLLVSTLQDLPPEEGEQLRARIASAPDPLTELRVWAAEVVGE